MPRKNPSATGPERLPPIHPGEILYQEFMVPLGLTKYRLAADTGMPPDRVGRIVAGTRSVSADTALRLARYLGTTPQFWLHLQARYDLDLATDKLGTSIARQVRPLGAA